ncbi:MAG: MopE-related protein [Myxococcota bacterium]
MWLALAAGVASAGVEVDGVAYSSINSASAQGAVQEGSVILVVGLVTEVEPVRLDVGGVVVTGAPGAVLSGTSSTGLFILGAGVDLTVSGVRLERSATGIGVAMDRGASLTMTDVSVDGGARAIYAPSSLGTLTLTDVQFEAAPATVDSGGAIYVSGGLAVLTDVSFDQVGATARGGAIYADGSQVTCRRCAFDGTAAPTGGAIYLTQGRLTLVDSSICGVTNPLSLDGDGYLRANRVTEGDAVGDALVVLYGNWTVENNDFLGNGGGAVLDFTGASQWVRNNLFRDNAGTDIVYGAVPSIHQGYNWFDGAGAVIGGPGITATDVATGADPLLTSWTPDGTCAGDVLWPVYGSPLVDAGDPAVADPDGSRSDIGAYGGPESDPYVHTDHDGDGVVFSHDCADDDDQVFPGNVETCDGFDDDCDALVDDDDPDVSGRDVWHADCDGDGQGVAAGAVEACLAPVDACVWLSEAAAGGAAASDCDDADASVYLGADERCAAGDQDCDGDADLGAVDALAYWPDADADDFGDPLAASVLACADPSDAVHYVLDATDCDDADPLVHPQADERCNGIDDDCDATVDVGAVDAATYWPDVDADGFGDATAEPVVSCADPSDAVHYVAEATDCDDADAAVHPLADELCNGIDDDCDGATDADDADLVDGVTAYPDRDHDGYGACPGDTDCAAQVCADDLGQGWSQTLGDCDDADPLRSPGNVEEPGDDLDEDCDGTAAPASGGEGAEAPPAEAEDRGCGCATQRAPVGGWVWLVLVAGLVWRGRAFDRDAVGLWCWPPRLRAAESR